MGPIVMCWCSGFPMSSVRSNKRCLRSPCLWPLVQIAALLNSPEGSSPSAARGNTVLGLSTQTGWNCRRKLRSYLANRSELGQFT